MMATHRQAGSSTQEETSGMEKKEATAPAISPAMVPRVIQKPRR